MRITKIQIRKIIRESLVSKYGTQEDIDKYGSDEAERRANPDKTFCKKCHNALWEKDLAKGVCSNQAVCKQNMKSESLGEARLMYRLKSILREALSQQNLDTLQNYSIRSGPMSEPKEDLLSCRECGCKMSYDEMTDNGNCLGCEMNNAPLEDDSWMGSHEGDQLQNDYTGF